MRGNAENSYQHILNKYHKNNLHFINFDITRRQFNLILFVIKKNRGYGINIDKMVEKHSPF